MKRAWGTGRIFRPQRADGRLLTSYWWISYYVNGKEYRQSTKSDSEQVARAALRAKLKEIGAVNRGHEQFVSPKAEKQTINQLLDSLLADYEARGCLDAPINTAVKFIRQQFGEWRATQLRDEHVDRWISGMKAEGYANATINRRTQILGQAFRHAKLGNRVPTITKLSEKGNARKGFFTREEVDRLYPFLPVYLNDAFLFAFRSSWRQNEVLTLTWDEVEWNDAKKPVPVLVKLRAERSKEREPRSIPLDDELQQIILRRFERKKGPLVFHHNGHAITDMRKAWGTATRKAHLTGKIWHDLRRSGVREMILSGVPQAVAMEISGHKTDSMFRRYAIFDEAAKLAAMNRVAERQRAEVAARRKAKPKTKAQPVAIRETPQALPEVRLIQ